MKSNIKIFTLILVLTTSCMVLPRQTEAQQQNISFQVFYDELSPYGQWIDYGNYGYVWIPDAGYDFAPYSTNGRWIMTQYGWTWASDYNWGWAAFHYGRWSFNDSFGWYWVPDNEWGPAWVNWRQADGYYGWSPMEPGMTISMSFNNQYDNNYNNWYFVRDRDFDRANVNQYYVNRNDYDRIGRSSVVINNTYTDNRRHATYVTGPSRTAVQTVTGRRIVPVAIQESNRPGKGMNNGRLQIYRPQVERNNAGQKPVPTRVINQNDVKRRPARDASNSSQQVNPGNMQERPVNRVIQENNNAQPVQPRNAEPNNADRKSTQPVQQREINTPDNSQPVRQNNTPVNQDRNARPTQTNQQREVNNPDPQSVQRKGEPDQQREINRLNNPKPKQEQGVNRQDNRSNQRTNVNSTNNNRPVNETKSIRHQQHSERAEKNEGFRTR